jgi:hypothetical protein
MPPPYTGLAQGRIIGSIHGQTTVNVMHFSTNSVINDVGNLNTHLLALAEALKECILTTLLPGVTSDWTFVNADARVILPTPSDPIIATGAPENVGELSPCSHSITASLLRIKSGIGGRSGRGRVFLPPAGETEITQSTLDTPTLLLLAAFAACMGSKFMGDNKTTVWQLGILSQKKLKEVGGTMDNSFFEASSLSPVADVAYMGSRRKGRGV